MNKRKIVGKGMLVLSVLLSVLSTNAQKLMDTVPPKVQQVEMASGMRSNGKIYVVVAVLSMVLIGLFIYLLTLDRRISKMEKMKDK